MIRRVVIVGGGTAGWLTAAILAADHCGADPDGLDVVVVEAPGIPTLGVGEGTWPSMRDTLRRIGISETVFIRRCAASFKQGTRFDGWLSGADDDSYFHPFSAPPNPDDCDPLALWRAAGGRLPFASAVSAQPDLCLEGKAPKQITTPEYAAVANYAYHLDAGAFAELLREHATAHLGVTHLQREVTRARLSEVGRIAALSTQEGDDVEGDLFIDCTGMRALLLGEALGSPLTDVSPVLFNDRALALHVPYRSEEEPIASQTNATAVSAGWIWDIGLVPRRGVGHVFSSAFAGEEEARARLDRYLEKTARGSGVRAEDARLIPFRSAYREEAWRANCVGVGMAQGFVEPLEASAIVMAELAAAMISDLLPPRASLLAAAAERFNARFSYRWERIVDFLKLHYIVSKRSEPYWEAHRDEASWTPRLRTLMERWRHEPPSREDFPQTQEIFTAASYAYVLYGSGFATQAPAHRRRRDAPEAAQRTASEIETARRRLLRGLPTNRQLVQHILERGLSRV